MVQVVKDLLGIKGVCLIIDIILFFCYLVFMSGVFYVGVFQWIESEVECECLKKVVVEYCDEQGGFIICIVVEGVYEQEMVVDVVYFKCVWIKVMECKKCNQICYQLYGELVLVQCVLCDFVDV